MNNKYFDEDIKEILTDPGIPWNKLDGKTVLITGATGLLGTLLTHTFVKAEDFLGIKINTVVQIRNREKAEAKLPTENIKLIEKDIRDDLYTDDSIDYIIHAASITDSRSFVERPVEVIDTTFNGTLNVLKLGKEKKVKGFVYLSTMEVYGTPQTDEKISEDRPLDTRSDVARNSYPVGKIAAENLCKDFSDEYDLPCCILRLTQTFGPGVEEGDRRVFAEMMTNACAGQDIILKTKGETKRSYLYTADAVRAIVMAMLDEDMCSGEIFNVANESTYCSIADMGDIAIKALGNGNNKVRFEIEENISSRGFAPTLHMNLDTGKIHQKGWNPQYGLAEMFVRMAGK